MSKTTVDIDFVELPSEEFNCPICLGILQDPYLTACCGNHFCEACIDNVKNNNDKCPLCQAKPLNGVVNKHFKRKLNELKVYCTHKREGCKWKGDYGKLNQHLAIDKTEGECQFVMLKCPLSSMCGKLLPRKSLTHHTNSVCNYRQFSCKHCGFLSSYHVVTTQHVNKCVNYPMSCPNECSKQTYPRSQLKTHLSSCPEQVVDCNFKEMGCKAAMKRHMLQQHLESNSLQHQMIMCQAFKSLQKDKEKLEKKVADLTLEVARSSSEVDYWTKGFKLVATAMKENEWSLYLSKMTEIAAIKPATSPLIYKIPFRIAQVNCNGSCEIAAGGRYAFRRSLGGMRHSHYKASSYLSGPFYSHPNGYKIKFITEFVCHCLDCRERHFGLVGHSSVQADSSITASVLVDFYLLPGECDTELKWPFEFDATITLLNEQINENHQKVGKTYTGNKCTNATGIKLHTKQPAQPKGNRLSQVAEQLRSYHMQPEKMKQLYQEYCKYAKPDTICFAFNDQKCLSKLRSQCSIHTSTECESELFLEINIL